MAAGNNIGDCCYKNQNSLAAMDMYDFHNWWIDESRAFDCYNKPKKDVRKFTSHPMHQKWNFLNDRGTWIEYFLVQILHNYLNKRHWVRNGRFQSRDPHAYLWLISSIQFLNSTWPLIRVFTHLQWKIVTWIFCFLIALNMNATKKLGSPPLLIVQILYTLTSM